MKRNLAEKGIQENERMKLGPYAEEFPILRRNSDNPGVSENDQPILTVEGMQGLKAQ